MVGEFDFAISGCDIFVSADPFPSPQREQLKISVESVAAAAGQEKK